MDEMQMTQAAMSAVEEIIRAVAEYVDRGRLSDKQSQLLDKFIKGTGVVMGSDIPNEHIAAVRQQLIDQDIPFMEMASSSGGTMILVRHPNEEKLMEIEDAISMQDTMLAKELTQEQASQMLDTLRQDRVITLSFNDAMMAEKAKQKLFQTGHTFAATQRPNLVNGRVVRDENGNIEMETVLVISSKTQFKENGNDLESFQLQYALTQARGMDRFDKDPVSGESVFIDVIKKQVKFDRDIVEKFVEKAKNGEDVILGDVRGSGPVYMEARDGDIFICNRDNDKRTQIFYDKNDPVNVVAATLSRHSDKIYESGLFDPGFYEQKVRRTPIMQSDLPANIQANRRPRLTNEDAKRELVFKRLEPVIKSINARATQKVIDLPNYKTLSPEQKQQRKHQYICDMLRDTTDPDIAEYLANDQDGSKREVFDNMVENYTNQGQNTRYSADVANERTRDIKRLFANEPEYVSENTLDYDLDM